VSQAGVRLEGDFHEAQYCLICNALKQGGDGQTRHLALQQQANSKQRSLTTHYLSDFGNVALP
jgi:hypothetical protein